MLERIHGASVVLFQEDEFLAIADTRHCGLQPVFANIIIIGGGCTVVFTIPIHTPA